MIRPVISCDIFCRVVDNFGDIGVAWRLARQLAHEHHVAVRLIIDDLSSFKKIEPAIDVASERQEICGVKVLGWDLAADMDPADFVIEAFAVNLPAPYEAAMAMRVRRPVWVNLEYLSAEAWVGTHHLLPSPHPRLPLCKYFFFPGFLPDTGGLIREHSLLDERDVFKTRLHADELRVFMFCYRNAAGVDLLCAMGETGKTIRCTVPDGAFAKGLPVEGLPQRKQLTKVFIETKAFSDQRVFDQELWQHDVLFVRGEDSFVRAQWAGRPFIWQIYPQKEDAHWSKLDAFLNIYCEGLETDAASDLKELWRAWNAEDRTNIATAWRRFILHLPALEAHALEWSKKIAQMPDLAANLLSFYQKNTKI